jgi:nitroreductase
MDRAVIAPGGHPPTRVMSVSEAVARHRTVRGFLDRPVDREKVLDILRRAARAPSGGNLQPWVITTIDGQRLSDLKALMRGRCSEHPDGEPLDFAFYPTPLKPAYARRRMRNGEILYSALGIDRNDALARRTWIHENFQFFGAPFGVFCFLERSFGPSHWLDLGIYLQTVLLLLTEAGYASCPQADWAMFERTVKQFLNSPPDLRLVCGIAVGYPDETRPENLCHTERDNPLQSYEIRSRDEA